MRGLRGQWKKNPQKLPTLPTKDCYRLKQHKQTHTLKGFQPHQRKRQISSQTTQSNTHYEKEKGNTKHMGTAYSKLKQQKRKTAYAHKSIEETEHKSINNKLKTEIHHNQNRNWNLASPSKEMDPEVTEANDSNHRYRFNSQTKHVLTISQWRQQQQQRRRRWVRRENWRAKTNSIDQ